MKKETYQTIEKLYEDNRIWVYGYFRKKVSSVEIAEDLVQTLWLNFFRAYERIRSEDEKTIKAYLKSMALHLTADYYRSQKKSDALIKELSQLIEENSSNDSVFQEAFPEDALQYLDEAYGLLSEEERFLLFLKYNKRNDSKEIAAIMGISPSLVRMRISRINAKLRNAIQKKLKE